MHRPRVPLVLGGEGPNELQVSVAIGRKRKERHWSTSAANWVVLYTHGVEREVEEYNRHEW